MKRKELIDTLAHRLEITKKEAARFLDCFQDTVIEAVAKGEHVKISGFGSFQVKTRGARIGINPQTKEKLEIGTSLRPHFKASGKFKQLLNEK